MPQNVIPTPADHTVWEEFKKGDREAFAQLYRTHIHSLIGYGMRITGDQSVVKDAIQDLFMELWRSKEQLQPPRSVQGYLLTALRYKLMRNAKVQKRYERDVPDQPDTINIESTILLKEAEILQKAQIQRAISQLPPRQQEVINLRFFYGCSTEDVAGIMGMNYQSATNLLHRAVLHLRKFLEK
jgi:RNA polymerase sigma-70 factor (ECF subfamily)